MQRTALDRHRLVPVSELGQRGASAVEYALLTALIAAVIVSAVIVLGLSVDDLFGVDLTPDP